MMNSPGCIIVRPALIAVTLTIGESKMSGTFVALRQAGWIEHVNRPLTELELLRVRRSVQRGVPFGDANWTERTVHKLGLETTLRPRGRPKKPNNGPDTFSAFLFGIQLNRSTGNDDESAENYIRNGH